MPVELQKHFSVEDCNNNPDKIYVFGDNLIHKGKRGQAIIRDCPNSYGIPTKRLPSMEEDAFFSDQKDEIKIVMIRLMKLHRIYSIYLDKTIVFPADGLGTGRAQLKERSPIIYSIIDVFLKENFNISIMK